MEATSKFKSQDYVVAALFWCTLGEKLADKRLQLAMDSRCNRKWDFSSSSNSRGYIHSGGQEQQSEPGGKENKKVRDRLNGGVSFNQLSILLVAAPTLDAI